LPQNFIGIRKELIEKNNHPPILISQHNIPPIDNSQVISFPIKKRNPYRNRFPILTHMLAPIDSPRSLNLGGIN